MDLHPTLHGTDAAASAEADRSPSETGPRAAGGPLLSACRAVLRPLARLAIGHGLTYAELADVLKVSYVEAARAAHPNVPATRAVSRISATTGLNRREVSRLLQPRDAVAPVRHSPATEIFTRWLGDPALRDAQGSPVALPVQGPAPSFEALAQSVTRDVHPRTLLEELMRLALARMNEQGQVQLVQSASVPRADLERMLAFLGANVGDHLGAAVENVLSDGSRHFEQALFADELSDASMAQARTLVTAEWQRLVHTLAPALQALIDADAAAGRVGDQRMRIGLFAFTDAMAPRADPAPSPVTPTPGANT